MGQAAKRIDSKNIQLHVKALDRCRVRLYHEIRGDQQFCGHLDHIEVGQEVFFCQDRYRYLGTAGGGFIRAERLTGEKNNLVLLPRAAVIVGPSPSLGRPRTA